MTELFFSIRQAYLPAQAKVMAKGREMAAAEKAAAATARAAKARRVTAASLTRRKVHLPLTVSHAAYDPWGLVRTRSSSEATAEEWPRG